MNLIKCNNNHYYDADKFPACPYCSDMQSGFSQTMPANEQSDIGPTQPETEVTTTTTQTFKRRSAFMKKIWAWSR